MLKGFLSSTRIISRVAPQNNCNPRQREVSIGITFKPPHELDRVLTFTTHSCSRPLLDRLPHIYPAKIMERDLPRSSVGTVCLWGVDVCILCIAEIAGSIAYIPGNSGLATSRPGQGIATSTSINATRKNQNALRNLVLSGTAFLAIP